MNDFSLNRFYVSVLGLSTRIQPGVSLQLSSQGTEFKGIRWNDRHALPIPPLEPKHLERSRQEIALPKSHIPSLDTDPGVLEGRQAPFPFGTQLPRQ